MANTENKNQKDTAKSQKKSLFKKSARPEPKAEAKANFKEAKQSPAARQKMMQEEREQQIAEANKRKTEAEARIAAAKKR